MELFHDATPTWSGFNYQGKLAIFHTLKLMNSLNEREYNNYELELEWFEDFAIKKDGIYESVHQVKAYNSNSINKYEEAICGLFRRIIERDEVGKGYLHTWKKIDCDWYESIKEIIENYLLGGDPNIVDIKCKLSNELEFEKLYKEVHESRKGRKSNLKKFIQELLGDEYEKVEKDEFKLILERKASEFNSEFDNYKLIYDKDINILNKILQYSYGKDTYCELNNVKVLIKDEIKKYLERKGDESKANEVDHINNVYMSLLGCIDENIIDRHIEYNVNTYDKKKIKFNEIKEILDKDIEHSEKFYLYKLKDRMLDKLDEICSECSIDECDKCDECNIETVKHYIEAQNLAEFKKFCHISSPNIIINKSIDLDLFSKVIPPSELGVYLCMLSEIEKGWKFEKALSHNKVNLLTTVSKDGIGLRGEKKVANDILKNKNIHEELMEYKLMISRDVDIESLMEVNSNISKISDQDLGIEMDKSDKPNINKINKIKIKSAERYLKETYNNDKGN